MKKLTLIAAAALALGGAVWTARAESAEEAAVRAAVGHYLRAHATGLGEHHRKVFHPEAKLFAVREGKFWQLTSEEYISRSPGKPAADEAQRKRSIESVDIAGDAAVAKVVLDYPQVRFTDYMSLLKIDGEWRIVNKTFHAEQKAK
ncbi:MAG TPA: nuclear transport factor 2 family protein [Pyrinomonadaceae bacterium]|nr:nuclear transport factor 2 family protein [Pyrinomonadaceae bacterium]